MSFNNDDDLKRLLRKYYQPAAASSDFKEKLHKLVTESDRAIPDARPSNSWLKPLLWVSIGAVATVALIVLGIMFFPREQPPIIVSPTTPQETTPTSSPITTTPTIAPTSPTTPTTSPVAIAKGILELRVTDVPPQHNVTRINVILTDVRVNRSATTDTDAGWLGVFAGPVEFDLLQLKASEVASILGESSIEVGHYSQVRMDVQLVNAVIDGQSTSTGIELPSSTLRLVGSFDIKENQRTILTIDFDAEKSLVFTGEGKVIFKPTVTLIVEYPD